MDPSALPAGGSTGADHVGDDRVGIAATWLATTPRERRPRPILPHVQRTFGLSPAQACQAIEEANLRRARAL